MATLNQIMCSVEPMQRFIEQSEQLAEAVNNSSCMKAMSEAHQFITAVFDSPGMKSAAEALRRIDQALKTPAAQEFAEQLRRFIVEGLPVAPPHVTAYHRWEPPSESEDSLVESRPAREYGLLPAYKRRHGY